MIHEEQETHDWMLLIRSEILIHTDKNEGLREMYGILERHPFVARGL